MLSYTKLDPLVDGTFRLQEIVHCGRAAHPFDGIDMCDHFCVVFHRQRIVLVDTLLILCAAAQRGRQHQQRRPSLRLGMPPFVLTMVIIVALRSDTRA